MKIKNKEIGHGKPCFIIAEAGSNHNKDIKLAKKLIDAAAEAQADAIKFQLFTAKSLYPSNCGKIKLGNENIDFFKLLKTVELPILWLSELKKYAEMKGIIFMCSPFDEKMVDELEKIGIESYKIASPELNHLPLLEYIAKKNKPIICSTGLCKLGDIEEAIDTISKYHNKIAVLHCISAYPTPLEDCNLNILETLNKVFNMPIGFSDHTLDSEIAPSIAVFKGACIIEKHFTIDKNLSGPDHKFALNPIELKRMINAIRMMEKISKREQKEYLYKKYGKNLVNKILGSYKKIIPPSEKELYPGDKRSIHAVGEIKKGDKLTARNIRVLRSERNLNPGIHPKFYGIILGCKAKRKISYGQGILWEDILDYENSGNNTGQNGIQ